MALAFVDLSRPIAADDVERILTGYRLSAHISTSALTAQVIAVTQWVSKQWPEGKTLPEWPVEAILPTGQVLNGRIDLLVDTGSHWVLIDHNVPLLLGVCDRIHVLDEGLTLAEGTAEEIHRHPEVSQAYLGVSAA